MTCSRSSWTHLAERAVASDELAHLAALLLRCHSFLTQRSLESAIPS